MILKIFMDAMFLMMIYMGAREMYSYYKETMGE